MTAPDTPIRPSEAVMASLPPLTSPTPRRRWEYRANLYERCDVDRRFPHETAGFVMAYDMDGALAILRIPGLDPTFLALA